ncbi:MAG: TM1266 family iron-only hydrogenase system putative regulator [Bacteroidota bacterium]|nr:TM1266 family iron-only hydrogenase system putative regulator [Bacteroidota bacterium]
MEKRIGSAIILLENTSSVNSLNEAIFQHSSIIIGRQGIPMRGQGINIISLVLYGTTDEIGSLTGKIGRLPDIQVKSVLLKGNYMIDD